MPASARVVVVFKRKGAMAGMMEPLHSYGNAATRRSRNPVKTVISPGSAWTPREDGRAEEQTAPCARRSGSGAQNRQHQPLTSNTLSGPHHIANRDHPDRSRDRLVHQLTKLGYQVELTPIAA
jgi:hypothetical protein